MPLVNGMRCAKTQEIGLRTVKSWIVKNSSSIPSMITKCNQNMAPIKRDQIDMRTFDFSKIYINIELDDLEKKLLILIDRLFNFKRSTSRNRFLTVPRDDSKESRWTLIAFDESKIANV